MQIKHTIEFNAAGLPLGAFRYELSSFDGFELPSEQVECSESQHQDYQAYRLVKGKVTAATDADLLPAALEAKVAELNDACAAAIVAGFESDALGETYSYPSKIEDQLNLTGVIQMLSISPTTSTTFKCADRAGVWAKRPHTLEQLQKVGVTFALIKQTLIDAKDDLVEKAKAATTLNELAAVVWSEVQA